MKKFAFVFPGQGSQSVGMLADLAPDYSIIQQTFAQASDALGYDLWVLTQMGPAERLNETDKTQPALLAASVALWRIYQASGNPMPELMAGHSLGEYSALVCAEALDFVDAIKLVEKRGQLMQQAVPLGTGAMYAVIGLENDIIGKICQESAQDQVVSPVNYNSPGQVVIAGDKAAVERAAANCKEAGAKMVVALPVSVPSHCALMEPAAKQLQLTLESIPFAPAKIKVINNVDVAVASSEAEMKDALVRQLYNPVRWTETIEAMISMGIEQVYEMGPGKVLTGLTKRINRKLPAKQINDLSGIIELTQGL